MKRSLKMAAAMLAAGLVVQPALAVIETYLDEAAYISALAARGYNSMHEDFEGAEWDPYHSPLMAPSVTLSGITWSGNGYISTNTNWGHNWTYGIFTTYTGGPLTPEVLTGVSDQTLYGVGGWISVNGGTDIAILINGLNVAERPISGGHLFLGVIDTDGFTSFDIIDVEQHASIGADEFTFAVAATLHGDLDGDCDVDLADLSQMLANYGVTSGATYEQGDLDGDGDVDLSDLSALLSVYGTVCQ